MVQIVSVLTTILFLRDLITAGEKLKFTFQIIVWLWITLLFANFAEAVAEGRGRHR
jgi:K+-transporting ATPase ATPase B chain